MILNVSFFYECDALITIDTEMTKMYIVYTRRTRDIVKAELIHFWIWI